MCVSRIGALSQGVPIPIEAQAGVVKGGFRILLWVRMRGTSAFFHISTFTGGARMPKNTTNLVLRS